MERWRNEQKRRRGEVISNREFCTDMMMIVEVPSWIFLNAWDRVGVGHHKRRGGQCYMLCVPCMLRVA